MNHHKTSIHWRRKRISCRSICRLSALRKQQRLTLAGRGVAPINKVALQRARLVPRWATVSRLYQLGIWTSHPGQLSMACTGRGLFNDAAIITESMYMRNEYWRWSRAHNAASEETARSEYNIHQAVLAFWSSRWRLTEPHANWMGLSLVTGSQRRKGAKLNMTVNANSSTSSSLNILLSVVSLLVEPWRTCNSLEHRRLNNNNNNLRLLGLTSNRAINTVQHPPRRAALYTEGLSRLNCCHTRRTAIESTAPV